MSNYEGSNLVDLADEILTKMRSMMEHYNNYINESLEYIDNDELKSMMKDYSETYSLIEEYIMTVSVMQDVTIQKLDQILTKLG